MKIDPADWPDTDPAKTTALIGQRDEFQRRALSARRAFEDIRKAYEDGDLDAFERILFMNTGSDKRVCRHPSITIKDQTPPREGT